MITEKSKRILIYLVIALMASACQRNPLGVAQVETTLQEEQTVSQNIQGASPVVSIILDEKHDLESETGKVQTTILNHFNRVIYKRFYSFAADPKKTMTHQFEFDLSSGEVLVKVQQGFCQGELQLTNDDLLHFKSEFEKAQLQTGTNGLKVADDLVEELTLIKINAENESVDDELRISFSTKNLNASDFFFASPHQLSSLLKSFVDGKSLNNIQCQ